MPWTLQGMTWENYWLNWLISPETFHVTWFTRISLTPSAGRALITAHLHFTSSFKQHWIHHKFVCRHMKNRHTFAQHRFKVSGLKLTPSAGRALSTAHLHFTSNFKQHWIPHKFVCGHMKNRHAFAQHRYKGSYVSEFSQRKAECQDLPGSVQMTNVSPEPNSVVKRTINWQSCPNHGSTPKTTAQTTFTPCSIHKHTHI